MTAPAIAMSIASALLMLHSGLLFDLVLIRRLANRHHLRLLARLSLVNFVIIPLATLALLSLVPAVPDLNLVLLMLAMMPCAPLVPAMANLLGEPPQLALFIFLCFSLLSFLLLPALLVVLPQPWAAGEHAKAGVGNYSGFAFYAVTIYVPLFLGIVIRLRDEARGLSMLKRLQPWMSVSITAALLLFSVLHWQELVGMAWRDIGVMLLFELMCVTIAMLFELPWRAVPVTNVLSGAFRNFTLGLALSNAVFPHTGALAYMVVFTLLMIPLIAGAVTLQRRCLCFEALR